MSTAAATGTYLEKIVDDVRARLAASSPLEQPMMPMTVRSLQGAIRARRALGELAIISEVKRRSPSVGAIAMDIDPATQAAAYADAGAAGISVLTEVDHFSGSLDDLIAARDASEHAATPVLRKDFIIDERQILDARAAGADVVLLIAAILPGSLLRRLVDAAHAQQLEVLMEVHDEEDLAHALNTDARIIGINNRDLRSFHVDLAVTERLAIIIPDDRLIVAESGIRTVQDARRMHEAGVDALLVGEALMRAEDPATLLRELATAAGTPS